MIFSQKAEILTLTRQVPFQFDNIGSKSPNFWPFTPIFPLAHSRNPGRNRIVKIPGLGKEMGFVARILTGVSFRKRKFRPFFGPSFVSVLPPLVLRVETLVSSTIYIYKTHIGLGPL